MAGDVLTCPMCGFEFARGDTLCAHGCPLGAFCTLIRCPSCEYEFPQTPKPVSWLHRWIERLRREDEEDATAGSAEAGLPPGVCTVRELRPGQRAELLCLGPRDSRRHRTLAVFGMAPGATVALVQRQPACVVRVGETELALDGRIAREVLVRPLADEEAAKEDADAPEEDERAAGGDV